MTYSSNNSNHSNNSDNNINFIDLNNANSAKHEQKNSTPETPDIKNKLDQNDNNKLDEIIEQLRRSNIKPLSNQQRNLDREEGGIEHENKTSEIHINDEWDKRAEEVTEMGKNINPNMSSGKKSMFWNLKRKRLAKKASEQAIQNLENDLNKLPHNQQQNNAFDSRKEQSITQKINALRHDRSDFKPNSNQR